MNQKPSERNLFDNEFTRGAMSMLTPEQKEEYQKIGEKMYGKIDFENSRILDNPEPSMDLAVASITETIKAGLHPSMMEDNEKAVMREVQGEKWYERFGFVEKDLTEIVTMMY